MLESPLRVGSKASSNAKTEKRSFLASLRDPQEMWTQGVLFVLLLRSALDLYSGKGVPAAFAIALDLLVLIYLGRQLTLRRPIHTDRFWWLLMGWIMLQSVWVVLLPLGGLGGTPFMAYDAMREWVRFFSLGMVYLLAMQLRDRISPDRLASILLLSLVVPLILAALQVGHIVPSFLESDVGWKDFEGTGDRINSTLGHYNSFATFTLLFIALSLWRMQMATKPLGWGLLVVGLLYCLIATKSLTGLVMLMVFGLLYFLPRLKGKGMFGAIALAMTLAVLLSSELGQERLLELNKTPLLNPDLSFGRAAALQAADMKEFRNSFNWRLLQWRDLLSDWQRYPLMGYGLASTKELSIFNTTSHNDYMRFLVEEGLVGFGLFLLFLAAQVGRVFQVMRRSRPGTPQRALCAALFPFSIALLVGMAAGNVMVHTATFFYWWVLLALLDWQWPAQFGSELPLPPPKSLVSSMNARPQRTFEIAPAEASDLAIYHSSRYDLSTDKPDAYEPATSSLDIDSDIYDQDTYALSPNNVEVYSSEYGSEYGSEQYELNEPSADIYFAVDSEDSKLS